MTNTDKIILGGSVLVGGILGILSYIKRDEIKESYNKSEEYLRKRIPEIKKRIEEFNKKNKKGNKKWQK